MPSVSVDGVELHFRDLGDGPPIVLLHPGPGTDGAIFFPWLEPLAEAHRVLALDLPGNGLSGAPTDPSLSGHARAARGFADALELEDYTLLGHSFGAFVALTQAVEHPGRAGRVIASCGAASEAAFDAFDERLTAFAADRPAVLAAFEAEDDVETEEQLRAAWKGQMPFFCADPDGPACAALVARLDEVRFSVAAVRAAEQLGELELLDALGSVEVPVLAIAGDEDRCIPAEHSAAIADAAPRGELVVVERAGHFPFAEQPEAYLAALGRLL
ncbi:MAG TPA: alpha/beta hydrolase [Capillimicrobium sp.]